MSTLAALFIASAVSLTAYAEKTLDRDYIESEIWEEVWLGKDDDGTEFPAEQKQTPGEYIEPKILLNDSSKTIYCFAHIGISAYDVDILRMAHITYHRRTPSSRFRVSSLKSSGRLTTTFPTDKDICSRDTAISGSVLTGTISFFILCYFVHSDQLWFDLLR